MTWVYDFQIKDLFFFLKKEKYSFLPYIFVDGNKEQPGKPPIISLIVNCIAFVGPDFLITLLII